MAGKYLQGFHWNLFNKLFFTYLLFLILPVMGFSFLFQVVVMTHMKREIEENDRHSLTLLAGNSEHILKRAWTDAVSLSMDPRLDQLLQMQAHLNKGTSLEDEADYMSAVLDILVVLKTMNDTDELVHSFYIYNEETGMLLTSRGELMPASEYIDTEWLDYYEEDMNQICFIPARKPIDKGILEEEGQFLDVARDIYSPVITMLFPLAYHPYQSLNGAVVINLMEHNLLVQPEKGEGGIYFLLDREGRLLSKAADKEEQLLIEEKTADILAGGGRQGALDVELRGKHYILSYQMSGDSGLLFLKLTPLSDFFGIIRKLQYLFLLITLAVLVVGSILAYRFTRRFYSPIQTALSGLKRIAGEDRDKRSTDELKQINQAVEYILRQNREVHQLLDKNRLNLREAAVMEFISGNTEKGRDIFQLNTGLFVCFVLTIDGYRGFSERYSNGEQYTIRSLLLQKAEESLPNRGGGGVLLSSDKIALVVQVASEEVADELASTILESCDMVPEVSVVLSRGGVYEGWDSLRCSFLEAQENLVYRISFTKKERYFHPIDIKAFQDIPDMETHIHKILNLLKGGDEESLKGAVLKMFSSMYDQRILSYEQAQGYLSPLVAGTNRFLRQLNIPDSRVMDKYRSLYELISGQETREELEGAITSYYERAVQLVRDQLRDSSTVQQLLDYIRQNSRDPNLDLTSLSDAFDLSYSHTRKLIKDESGLSFVDFLNRIRIDEARILLKESKDNLKVIAAKVGYHNDQSFSRFFKKYEGISPGEFRRYQPKGKA